MTGPWQVLVGKGGKLREMSDELFNLLADPAIDGKALLIRFALGQAGRIRKLMMNDLGGAWKEGAGLGGVITDGNHQIKGDVVKLGKQL